ncbi:radical SAM protein [Clostridium sp. LP20]|uniref:radical SAM protein n=1 Tax=Clostridium sp. LP20 TaxID=3418665 RepID=UPI003EE4BD43
MKYGDLLNSCMLCKRECGVDRLSGKIGVCAANDKLKIARAELHLWEEPPISGEKGSGTVFFSHCNLKCVFCQNHEISQEYGGAYITIERLSEIFLELQAKGANNINLVTPTHYVPQLMEALDIAKSNGLSLPILYNTNGYDRLETIKLLDGYIDVYLPDFKYFNDKFAVKYSKADKYLENILPLLKEMVRQTGSATFNDKGTIKKGVIIRHLMLPGLLFDSKKVIDKIYDAFGDDVYISIMNQYTPMNKASDYPEINKHLNPKHYDSLINYAAEIGVTNGFIQDEGANTEEFVPSFKLEGVFK